MTKGKLLIIQLLQRYQICAFIDLPKAVLLFMLPRLVGKVIIYLLIYFLQTALSFINTYPHIPPVRFMTSIVSSAAFGGFTFAAFSVKTIAVIVGVTISLYLIES